VCRKGGLERKRRCGWIGSKASHNGEAPSEKKNRPVWARGDVVLHVCPTSFITAESAELVQEFFVRKRLSGFDLSRLTARQVEAFAILDNAWITEINDGQQNTR
jgi:hypothetical protein